MLKTKNGEIEIFLDAYFDTNKYYLKDICFLKFAQKIIYCTLDYRDIIIFIKLAKYFLSN